MHSNNYNKATIRVLRLPMPKGWYIYMYPTSILPLIGIFFSILFILFYLSLTLKWVLCVTEKTIKFLAKKVVPCGKNLALYAKDKAASQASIPVGHPSSWHSLQCLHATSLLLVYCYLLLIKDGSNAPEAGQCSL